MVCSAGLGLWAKGPDRKAGVPVNQQEEKARKQERVRRLGNKCSALLGAYAAFQVACPAFHDAWSAHPYAPCPAASSLWHDHVKACTLNSAAAPRTPKRPQPHPCGTAAIAGAKQLTISRSHVMPAWGREAWVSKRGVL